MDKFRLNIRGTNSINLIPTLPKENRKKREHSSTNQYFFLDQHNPGSKI